MRCAWRRAGLAVALLIAAGSARAAEPDSFNLERLRLDPGAHGALVVGNGEVTAPNDLRSLFALHFEYRPLIVTNSGDVRGDGFGNVRTRAADLVISRTTAHVGFAAGLAPRLEASLELPVVAYQAGGNDALNVRSPDAAGIAAPGLEVRYAVLSGGPNTAAVALGFRPRWLRNFQYGGERAWIFEPRVEGGHRMGVGQVSAFLGARLRTAEAKLTNGEKLGQEVLTGAAFSTLGTRLRWELAALGDFNFNGLSQRLELLAGVRVPVNQAEVFLLAGPGFLEAPGTPTFRALLGVAFGTRPPPAAPAAPAAAATPPPPPPPDPCAAGQAHTPEQCPALDDDGDGIANAEDRCPTEKGIPELHGCPAKDADGDGIPDHLDKCPDQPGVPELQGCPPARAEIKESRIDIKERIYFDTGKAVIQPRSYPVLDDVAALLVANPHVTGVVIQGHTDNRGPAAFNRKLSQARAEAVRDYLVKKGVDAGRLEAMGFGPDQPTADNASADGREKNRRVEFAIKDLKPNT